MCANTEFHDIIHNRCKVSNKKSIEVTEAEFELLRECFFLGNNLPCKPTPPLKKQETIVRRRFFVIKETSEIKEYDNCAPDYLDQLGKYYEKIASCQPCHGVRFCSAGCCTK